MKNIAWIILMLLVTAGAFAQAPVTTEPSVPQTVPSENPAPTTTPEKKPEFNSPTQAPNRQPQTPSEDTLIRGQKSSAAIVRDTLMPSANRKKDRTDRRKNRKGTSETDDTTGNSARPDPAQKPS